MFPMGNKVDHHYPTLVYFANLFLVAIVNNSVQSIEATKPKKAAEQKRKYT